MKRSLPHSSPAENDIYVSRKSNFNGQVARAMKLLDSSAFDRIRLFGVGAAIRQTVDIALEVNLRMLGTVIMGVNTYTVEITDDLVPDDLDMASVTSTRCNSALLITLQRQYHPHAALTKLE